MRRFICIGLSLVMMLTVAGTNTFALKASAATPKPATPTGVKALSGYMSVKLTWKPVKGADRYIIMRSVAGKKKFSQVGVVSRTSYTDKISKPFTDYAYRIYAAKKINGKLVKSAPAKKRKNSVRRLRIYVTLKSDKKVDGHTIKKGTTLMTEAFGGGYYLFKRKGKFHSVPRVQVTNASAKYDRDNDYTGKEAALFINEYFKKKKISTNKKYCIWVSSYTQHAYAFKKKKGRWVTVRDWDVSMGRASTPSSTGTKQIKRKVFSHHGINFWNCFSGWNALHGVSGNMGASLGRLASHGCVRNSNKDAAWIYANCGVGTRVIIY